MSGRAAKHIATATKRLDLLKNMTVDLLDNSEVIINGFAANTLKEAEDNLELAAYSIEDTSHRRVTRCESLLRSSASFLREKALSLMGYSPNILDSLVEGLKGLVGGAVDKAGEWLDALYTWVTEAISKAVSGIWNTMTSAFTNLTVWITNTLDYVNTTVARGFNEVYQWTLGAIDGASEFLSPLAKTFISGFTYIMKGLEGLLSIDIADLVNMQVEAAKVFETKQLADMKKRAGVGE